MNKEFPRKFVPENLEFNDWNKIKPVFQNLLDRKINSKEELEKWLLNKSELQDCISEARAKRYINMTCHTNDQAIEKEYLNFVENVNPKVEPFWDKFNKKFINSKYLQELDQDYYKVLIRNIKSKIEIYRDENVKLETKDNKLSQEYQKIVGDMTVNFDGQDRTMPELNKYLENSDRNKREEAWQKIMETRYQKRAKFDDMYNKLIKIRNQIALNAGEKNYRDYIFKARGRFDYSPENCFKFHEAVQKVVVPLMRKISEERRQKMHLEKLRPWDTSADPEGRPALKPFEKIEELLNGCQNVFSKLDPKLEELFKSMRDHHELDLETRKGKAPGGYMYCKDEERRPFIFMNAAGTQKDVEVLFHESGHSFHSFECRNQPISDYRDYPIEFAEVASMSMELFANKYFGEFYSSKEDSKRARYNHIEDIIWMLSWIARIDEFQHWVYTHPNHTNKDRTNFWLELDKKYGFILDWEGLEKYREFFWQKQSHLFNNPFYYIEYGIAQLGALGLWVNYKKDKEGTLKKYLKALSLGNSKPLPELFKTAGIKFDFSIDTIKPLIEEINKELILL